MVKHFKALLLVLAASILLVACSEQPKGIVHLQGSTMGTTYNVKFPFAENLEPSKLKREIDELLVHINKLMSTYDPESELSLFNQHSSTDAYPLSQETLFVMKESKRLAELSGGALDVTIGPLIRLWGFDVNGIPNKIPDPTAIEAARLISGIDKFIIDETSAAKTVPELYVNLSTIAKGYGVDEVASLLEYYGITDYLVEIGGEMRVSGTKENQQPWILAVEKPTVHERAAQRHISIGKNAIATSGDYRNYFEQDGKRYSHIIDPVSGQPIQHNLVSVTVVHPSSMTADGLATALMVVGKDKALQIAQEHELNVLLITRENEQFKEYTSGQFPSYFLQ